MSHIQSLSTTYTGTKIYSTCPVATDTWKVYMEGTPWRMQITMETVNPVGQLLQFIINIESVKYLGSVKNLV